MNDTGWLDRNEYPFEPRYLDLEPGRMHYLDEGGGDPVVMVHGNPAWFFLYRNLIKGLLPEYRCVAMDHIGFGLSDKPLDWHYSPEGHAENLASLIHELGLTDITLVVQDWGGPIGLSYAVRNPERVKALIILNTWMWPVNNDWYYVLFSRFMGGVMGRFLIRRVNFFVRVIMPMAYGERMKLTGDIHRHFLMPLRKPQERKGCWVMPRQILGSKEWLGELWRERTAICGKPALIVWGMRDIAFRKKELKVWLEAFPAARVRCLEGAGHYVQEEGAVELNQAAKSFLTLASLIIQLSDFYLSSTIFFVNLLFPAVRRYMYTPETTCLPPAPVPFQTTW